MSVKIVDLAKKAGVTPGTVSIALSGRGRVSHGTRTRIQELARELGYTPNASAQLLKNKTPYDVKYFIGDLNPPAACIDDFLRFCDAYSLRYKIEFVNHAAFNRPPECLFDDCRGVLHTGYLAPALQRHLADNPRLPLVAVNEVAPYCVHTNIYAGAINAIEYLLARNFRKIAFFLCDLEYDVHRQINAAVDDAARSLALETRPEWRKSYRREPADVAAETVPAETAGLRNLLEIQETARRWAAAILDRPERPDAFFCSGCIQARGVAHEATRRGLRIPDDVALIAQGTDDVATDAYPHITNWSQNYVRNVHEGMILLQSIITGQPTRARQIDTESRLTPRGSTEKHLAI